MLKPVRVLILLALAALMAAALAPSAQATAGLGTKIVYGLSGADVYSYTPSAAGTVKVSISWWQNADGLDRPVYPKCAVELSMQGWGANGPYMELTSALTPAVGTAYAAVNDYSGTIPVVATQTTDKLLSGKPVFFVVSPYVGKASYHLTVQFKKSSATSYTTVIDKTGTTPGGSDGTLYEDQPGAFHLVAQAWPGTAKPGTVYTDWRDMIATRSAAPTVLRSASVVNWLPPLVSDPSVSATGFAARWLSVVLHAKHTAAQPISWPSTGTNPKPGTIAANIAPVWYTVGYPVDKPDIPSTYWDALRTDPVTYQWAPAYNAAAHGGCSSSALETVTLAGTQAAGPILGSPFDRPSVCFRFYGDTVTWVYATGPAAGKVHVYIDDADKGIVDQYSATAAQNVSKQFTGLSATAYHVIQLVSEGSRNAASTGYAMYHDAFLGKTDPADTVAVHEDNTDGSTFYTWGTGTDATAKDSRYAYATQAGAATAYTFSGTQVTWYYGKGPSLGLARIYLDGVNKGTIDCYNATQLFSSTTKVTYAGLAAGVHTILIVAEKNASTGRVGLASDAFEIPNGTGVTTVETSTNSSRIQFTAGTAVLSADSNAKVSSTSGWTQQGGQYVMTVHFSSWPQELKGWGSGGTPVRQRSHGGTRTHAIQPRGTNPLVLIYRDAKGVAIAIKTTVYDPVAGGVTGTYATLNDMVKKLRAPLPAFHHTFTGSDIGNGVSIADPTFRTTVGGAKLAQISQTTDWASFGGGQATLFHNISVGLDSVEVYAQLTAGLDLTGPVPVDIVGSTVWAKPTFSATGTVYTPIALASPYKDILPDVGLSAKLFTIPFDVFGIPFQYTFGPQLSVDGNANAGNQTSFNVATSIKVGWDYNSDLYGPHFTPIWERTDVSNPPPDKPKLYGSANTTVHALAVQQVGPGVGCSWCDVGASVGMDLGLFARLESQQGLTRPQDDWYKITLGAEGGLDASAGATFFGFLDVGKNWRAQICHVDFLTLGPFYNTGDGTFGGTGSYTGGPDNTPVFHRHTDDSEWASAMGWDQFPVMASWAPSQRLEANGLLSHRYAANLWSVSMESPMVAADGRTYGGTRGISGASPLGAVRDLRNMGGYPVPVVMLHLCENPACSGPNPTLPPHLASPLDGTNVGRACTYPGCGYVNSFNRLDTMYQGQSSMDIDGQMAAWTEFTGPYDQNVLMRERAQAWVREIPNGPDDFALPFVQEVGSIAVASSANLVAMTRTSNNPGREDIVVGRNVDAHAGTYGNEFTICNSQKVCSGIVADSVDSSHALVVWLDSRDSRYDIYGAYVTATRGQEASTPFLIAQGPPVTGSGPTHLDVCCTSSVWTVVWEQSSRIWACDVAPATRTPGAAYCVSDNQGLRQGDPLGWSTTTPDYHDCAIAESGGQRVIAFRRHFQYTVNTNGGPWTLDNNCIIVYSLDKQLAEFVGYGSGGSASGSGSIDISGFSTSDPAAAKWRLVWRNDTRSNYRYDTNYQGFACDDVQTERTTFVHANDFFRSLGF